MLVQVPVTKYDRFHMFMAGALIVGFIGPIHGSNNVISVDFKESHFEFRVYQELTKGHMDFSMLSLDSSSRKTWV